MASFPDIYLSIGFGLWAIVILRVIYCIGKYAFVMSFNKYPDLEQASILPGWNLFGEDDSPWALLAIANIGAYTLLGGFVIVLLWPASIFFGINSIIKYNRKKRFGR